jgi:hypothetical protein
LFGPEALFKVSSACARGWTVWATSPGQNVPGRPIQGCKYKQDFFQNLNSLEVLKLAIKRKILPVKNKIK